jgi:hypothetical protein
VPPYDETLDATLTADGDGDGDGDGTILVLEGAGWQIHAENLAAYLAGHRRGDTEARWGDLVPAYQELAASIS